MLKGCRTPIPNFKKATSGCWKSGSLLECVAIDDENADVRSYSFKDPAGGGFNHKAGQHISLLLPLEGGDEYRTFTIASSPTMPDEISLTIKTNRPNGATAWMRDNVKIGTNLTAVGPTGQFNIADNPCEDLLLISAGSGITPMMSMLRWLYNRRDDIKITFVHYAKTSDEYLFSEELSNINDDYSALNLYQISTHRDDGPISGLPTASQLKSIIEISDQTVFCCGPAGFMDVIKTVMLDSGLDEAQYHQESFGVDKVDNAPQEIDENAETVTVRFKDKIFEAAKGANLLNVLKQNKFVIPTGCKSGMCGTCQMKLESGSVKMNQLGGLSDGQIGDGYILACCSTLENNLTIS
ncbi:MAG: iron-sulfur cluster-binding domain-containing protein [Emcibacteraceae bacterium]|nr:iron-sulfur cluster-binding domain-containing protein [Emcibacteraceae bacterium]